MPLIEHLEKLQHFFAVAKCGKINEAAHQLGMTQPSISKSVKKLEEAVDCLLFLRKPNGVELTAEGELVYHQCHHLFAQLKDLEKKIKSPENKLSGYIRVGTYDSIAIYFWPNFLKAFLKKYPEIELDLTTGRSHEIQKKVEAGELDIGMIVEPKKTNATEVTTLLSDHFCFYRAKQMSLQASKSNNTPLIYMPGALAGQSSAQFESVLNARNFSRRLFRVTSLESVKELMLKGLGVGLLPKKVALPLLKRNSIHQCQLKDFPFNTIGSHTIGLLSSMRSQNSPVLKKLKEEILNSDFFTGK